MLRSWDEIVRNILRSWVPPNAARRAARSSAGAGAGAADVDEDEDEDASSHSPSPSPPPSSPVCCSAAAARVDELLDGAPVYRNLCVNPDALLNTLRYLYVHMRCGVFVSVRDGGVRAFVPFVNRQYTNTWHARAVLVDPRRSERGREMKDVHAYMAILREPRAREVLSLRRWWLNGATVCNIETDGGWSTAFLDELRAQLAAAVAAAKAAAMPLPDADFFLNKRDYPQLRARRGAEPYARFVGDSLALERESYSCYTPIFSFYTSVPELGEERAMADLPMPTPEDWRAACEAVKDADADTSVSASVSADMSTPPPLPKRAVALFRGSATGQGTTAATNVRLRLAHFSLHNADVVDAGIVAWNDQRDRVLTHAETRDLMHAETHELMHDDDAAAADAKIYISRPMRDVSLPLVPRMTMREQVAEAAYLLYADGHVAAGRYGTLMHTGRVILRIATEQPECGQLWAFYGTVGAVVDEDTIHATVPADADHFVIDAQLRNLRSTVLFLRANEAVAARVAACARRKAPTIESIAQYWRYAISAISQRQQQRRHAADAAAYAWFCAADPEYASTTASMTLKPM